MADSSNAVVYDARKNEVYGVTIYKSNQAEIRRKIVFNVKTGQNIIEIMHLPSCIQQDSVQVSCLGQVDILKSIYHSPGQNSGLLAKLKADDDNAIEELQRNATRLTILNEYALKASQEGTVKQLVDKLNEVEQERRNITNSTKSLQLSHERTAKQLAKQSLLNSRMTILLTASADGPGEIDLAYVVDGATWLPQYEVHASISPEYKKKPAIEICYRAALSQSTGEDWSNVKLMLSTASPLQVSAVPKLAPEFLKIEEDEEEEDDDNDDDEDGDEYSDISGGDAPPETISDESDEPVRPKKLANPTAFAKLPVHKSDTQQSNLSTPKQAESHTNPVSTTSLKIPGLITIPSCHDLQLETHQIPLAKIKFESADIQWITVPKEQATVFVQCMIKNTSEMTLLPEKAKVFINDVFVTTSGIPYTSPQQNFTCSLGPDPAVRVSYHPQTKKLRLGGEDESKEITTFQQLITITNTRPLALHRLIIRDQIPVSHDERIVVRILEPKELIRSKSKGPRQPLPQSTEVYWIQRDNEPAHQQEVGSIENLGLIEWVKRIDAGQSVDINLVWEVEAPSDLYWTKE